MSGEELTTVLEDDLLLDVRAFKQHLNHLRDLPPRLRQRLLLHGQCLEDTATLDSAMELWIRPWKSGFGHGTRARCVGLHQAIR